MVKIYVDARETASRIPEELRTLGVEVETANLETGDYILRHDVVIERKTAIDFVNSLLDGRIMNQAGKMVLNFERRIFLIEGDIYATRSAIKPEAITGAISYLVVILGCTVLNYRTPSMAANILHRMAVHAQTGLSYDVALRRGKVTPGKGEALFAIEGYAGVGPSTAKKLLNHFRSSFAFVNATVEQLMKVKGIGVTKAQRMYDGIHYELPAGQTVDDEDSLFTDRLKEQTQ